MIMEVKMIILVNNNNTNKDNNYDEKMTENN